MKCKFCFLIASLIVLLTTSCNGDKSTFHYKEYGLNCSVKSVKVTTYKAESKFGEIVNGYLEENGNYLAVFNDVGNLKSITYYDEDGDLSGMEKYKYNEENKVIEFSSYKKDGTLNINITYTYNNNQIESFICKGYWNNEEEIDEYKHKRDGERLVEVTITTNGELSSVTKYNNYSGQGEEWVTYNKDGKEITRGREVYDDKGRIVSRNEDEIHSEVQWNDNNLPTFLKNAFLHNNTNIVWYANGDEHIYYVEYEYDKKGNWIKQIVYKGETKKPLTISERIITY